MAMIEKTFKNDELDIELTSFVDNKQNTWFKGKEIAKILGYEDTDQAVRKQVDSEDKKQGSVKTSGEGELQQAYFMIESSFYSLILSSRLESAQKFQKWVTCVVLLSIRKYGYYKLV